MAERPLFLLLWVPDGARVGGSLKLLGAARSEEDAEKRLDSLDASITGTIAVAQVVKSFDRRPAIQNVPTDPPSFEGG